MHILENYALQLGQPINRPYLCEKFYPLPFDNYIVIQPWSKPSKNYKFWVEVIDLIYSYLQKIGLNIVQVGGKNEVALPNCYHTQGLTSFNQLEYIISNSKAVLSCDSISSHLAGIYDKPVVTLVSNNFSTCIKPYFGDKSKQIILEPNREKMNPSFMLDEGQNSQINTINSEKIVESILKLLNIDFVYPYNTVILGNDYDKRLIESVCDTPINCSNLSIDNLILRMDLHFDLDILIKQLQVIKCSIIFNKPIPLNLLKQFKPQITQLAYILDQNHDPKYADEIKKLGIPYVLLSKESPEWLNSIKLDYLDNKLILPVNGKNNAAEFDELKEIPLDKLFYKSNKFLLSKGKIYPGAAAWKEDKPISNLYPIIQPLINNKFFFEEINNYIILQKTD